MAPLDRKRGRFKQANACPGVLLGSLPGLDLTGRLRILKIGGVRRLLARRVRRGSVLGLHGGVDACRDRTSRGGFRLLGRGGRRRRFRSDATAAQAKSHGQRTKADRLLVSGFQRHCKILQERSGHGMRDCNGEGDRRCSIIGRSQALIAFSYARQTTCSPCHRSRYRIRRRSTSRCRHSFSERSPAGSWP